MHQLIIRIQSIQHGCGPLATPRRPAKARSELSSSEPGRYPRKRATAGLTQAFWLGVWPLAKLPWTCTLCLGSGQIQAFRLGVWPLAKLPWTCTLCLGSAQIQAFWLEVWPLARLPWTCTLCLGNAQIRAFWLGVWPLARLPWTRRAPKAKLSGSEFGL